jgi:hypothetical protein
MACAYSSCIFKSSMLDPSMELAPHASSKPPDSGLSALPTTQVAARIPAVSIVGLLSMYLHVSED